MNIRRIIRIAASNYLRAAITGVSTLLLTPILLRHLGAEGYGLWAVALSIQAYFSLADLGISNAASRFLARAYVYKDWQELNRTIGVALTIYCTLALLILVATVIIAVEAPIVFHTTHTPRSTVSILMAMIGILAVVGFLGVLPIQCAIASQHFDALNAWLMAPQVCTILATAIGVTLGQGLIFLAGLQLVNALVNLLIGIQLTKRYVPQARFRPSWSRAQARSLGSFAGYALLTATAARLIYSTDTLVISSVLSVAAVAPFAIALKGVQIMQTGVASANVGLGTFAVEAHELGHGDGIRRLWIGSTRWSLFITLSLATVFIVYGQDLLKVWVGRGYSVSGAIVTILVIGIVGDLSQNGGQQVLLNTGHHKFLAGITAGEAVANLGLSLILIRPFGVLGVALGTAIPMALRSIIAIPAYTSKAVGLPLVTYLTNAAWPPIKGSVLPIATVVLFHSYWPHHDAFGLIAPLTATAVASLAGGWLLGLSSDERRRVRALFSHPSAERWLD